MAIPVKIMAIGDAEGIILPQEILSRLNVGPGDSLCLIDTPYGIQLLAQEEEVAQQIEIAEKIMYENRDTLRRLAE